MEKIVPVSWKYRQWVCAFPVKRAVVDAKPFRINLSTLIVGCSTFIDDHDSVTLQPLSVVVLGLKCSENYAEKYAVSHERSPLWVGWTYHHTPFYSSSAGCGKVDNYFLLLCLARVCVLSRSRSHQQETSRPHHYLTLPSLCPCDSPPATFFLLLFLSCHWFVESFLFLPPLPHYPLLILMWMFMSKYFLHRMFLMFYVRTYSFCTLFP